MGEDKKSQREKFEEAARLAETDDREEVFDALLKKVAKAKPILPDSAMPKVKSSDQD